MPIRRLISWKESQDYLFHTFRYTNIYTYKSLKNNPYSVIEIESRYIVLAIKMHNFRGEVQVVISQKQNLNPIDFFTPS